MGFSTFLGNTIINHLLRNMAYTPPINVYASLHTGDPGLTGTNEVTGGSYVRQNIPLSNATTKTSTSASLVSYAYMPATSVVYAGLWDASVAGNFLMSGSLSASKIVNSGDTFQFPISNFTITLV